VTKLLPVVTLFTAVSALGHGSEILWEIRGDRIFLQATFDDGSPMDSAQVTVYSRSAPAEPWLSSFTDGNGTFSFEPDRELSQGWDVQVRKAGHGDIVYITLEEDAEAVHGVGLSTAQKILMSVCVVWGFTGTAFYFASRGKGRHAHS